MLSAKSDDLDDTRLLMKRIRLLFVVFFFFQAEDGIRDYKVTGVQTCALPIWHLSSMRQSQSTYCNSGGYDLISLAAVL